METCINSNKTDRRKRLISVTEAAYMYIVGDLWSLWLLIFEPNVLLQTELKLHTSWRPTAFAFRTKCYVHARDGNTCIYLKPGNTVRGGGGGLNSLGNWVRLIGFVQPGNSVRGTVFPRELGPGGTVFPKGIRSAGPKIGPDRIPYDTGSGREPMFPQSSRWTFVHYSYKVVA